MEYLHQPVSLGVQQCCSSIPGRWPISWNRSSSHGRNVSVLVLQSGSDILQLADFSTTSVTSRIIQVILAIMINIQSADCVVQLWNPKDWCAFCVTPTARSADHPMRPAQSADYTMRPAQSVDYAALQACSICRSQSSKMSCTIWGSCSSFWVICRLHKFPDCAEHNIAG